MFFCVYSTQNPTKHIIFNENAIQFFRMSLGLANQNVSFSLSSRDVSFSLSSLLFLSSLGLWLLFSILIRWSVHHIYIYQAFIFISKYSSITSSSLMKCNPRNVWRFLMLYTKIPPNIWDARTSSQCEWLREKERDTEGEKRDIWALQTFFSHCGCSWFLV